MFFLVAKLLYNLPCLSDCSSVRNAMNMSDFLGLNLRYTADLFCQDTRKMIKVPQKIMTSYHKITKERPA